MESQDILEHDIEAWTGHIPAPGEQALKSAACVFHTLFWHRDGKVHAGRFGFYAQMIEQCRQVRIIRLVEHDKAGIDRNGTLRRIHGYRRRMTADPAGFFENRDVARILQGPSRRETGNTSPYDRHSGPLLGLGSIIAAAKRVDSIKWHGPTPNCSRLYATVRQSD